ncbi:hypothetical protein Tco_0915729 [Tanacetum coccineum]
MTEAKGDGGEGLYVRGSSCQRDMVQGTDNAWSSHMESKQTLGFYKWGLKPSTYMSDYLFDFEEYDGDNIMLIDGREAVRGDREPEELIAYIPWTVRGLHKVYDEWASNHLGVSSDPSAEWSGLSKVFWAEYTTMSTYLMNRSPLSAIGFKTPEDMLEFLIGLLVKKRMLERLKSKCIFLGYHKGTGSVQVLQGVEFEVEPQEAHTFEVEPHVNFDHVAEDSNEAAFAVAAVEKIYAHESLTFNNTVACEQPVTTAMAITGRYTPVRVLQREVGTDFVGGNFYSIIGGSLSGDCGCGKKIMWINHKVRVDDTRMCKKLRSYDASHDGFSSTEAGYMTLTKATKEDIWLKGLVHRVRIRAKYSSGYCYRCLVKGYPWCRDSWKLALQRHKVIQATVCSWFGGLFEPEGRHKVGFRLGQILHPSSVVVKNNNLNKIEGINSQKLLTVCKKMCDKVGIEKKFDWSKTGNGDWKKLETLYMTKSLANRLYLKKMLYTLQMHPSKSQSEHIDEYHKLVGDLAAIDTAISDMDQLEDVLVKLNYRELQKMTEAKDDGGEGLYVSGRFGQRDMEQGINSAWSKSHGRSNRLRCYICQSEEHLKRDRPMYNHKKSQGFVRNEDQGKPGTGDSKGSSTNDGWAKFVLDNVRNMGFNESGEHKKTFIGFGVGTGLVQGNSDHIAGSQEVQTHDLIDYHSPRDREQHSARELFRYKEDNNEAAFILATVEKIYAYESLTFNDTVACEVISKWNAGLKEDRDVWSDVYMLSNGCRKCSDDNDGYYWEYTPGLLDKAKGNVLGHSILSLEGSLSRDCDVEKKRNVGMFDGFDRGLQTDALSTTEAGYMTCTEAWRKERWLKELLTESRYGLRLVEGIAIDALVKGSFRSAVLSITIG